MCVILIGKITPELHKKAVQQNPQGFSLFTKQQGLIKAPNKAQVRESFNFFGVYHYRIASSGRISNSNIHPFAVCNGKWLLYHNGVLGSGKGNLSDTAALAQTLKHATLRAVETTLQALSTRQRFALVSKSNPQNFRLYGDWVADAGVLMSHTMYSYTDPAWKMQSTAVRRRYDEK